MDWSIYNEQGQRKYLTSKEIGSFLYQANKQNDSVKSFCFIQAMTGCRISEVLSLSIKSIDFSSGHVVIDTLKKRDKKVYRSIPIPEWLLSLLNQQIKSEILNKDKLWPWSRMTAYRRVCEVMDKADIVGPHACPKGLRHSFAVRAIQSGAPLNLVQRWLGHSDIKTTAIYTNVMGPEERAIAARMWGKSQEPDPDSSELSLAQVINDYEDRAAA
jgi:integrase/recombinase XerD